MTRPNFFIPGGPKCGTTSLAAWLSTHPDIFVSNPKEPYFFNTDHALPSRVRTLAAYRDLFADAADFRAIGEATVFYLVSETALDGILAECPDARFLVCLRDPVTMARSMHAHWFAAGYEPIRDFAHAWNQLQAGDGRRRRRSMLDRQDRLLDYRRVCAMGHQVEGLLARVDRARVHFVLLDDWRDPIPTWHAVLQFLGVPDDGRREFPTANQCREARWPAVARLMSMASRARPALGIKPGSPVLGKLRKLNERPGAKPFLDPADAKRIREYFADDVRLLAGLIGRDLSGWLPGGQTPGTGRSREDIASTGESAASRSEPPPRAKTDGTGT